MYFLFFKLHSWGKRFGSSRRRFIQRFPNFLREASPDQIPWACYKTILCTTLYGNPDAVSGIF